MGDGQTMRAGAPAVRRREDYRPPDWLVPEIALDFDLDLSRSAVRSALAVERAGDADPQAPLVLDGDGIAPLAVRVDGKLSNDWRVEGESLVLPLAGDSHRIEIETAVDPLANTQLMGLYASNGMLCTQCEAEGFRRITFFPDRPDILSRYSVRMSADKARFPVLLSNGDLVGEGEAEGGRHWAEWHDPFPKPSYLFALVAGDLVANRDSFTTMSGRKVDLAIWVREGDLARTGHAMRALKAAMEWDEQAYGREYDLGRFNIVAVSDFNMGAMENKGLNIFNTRYVLADPDTATDADYDAIEGVIGHEYFHNWSGNRVTCRDWFQLSLKEGFTVFRDQQFSADMGRGAVKRIEDVRVLRAAQFPEDAGPLAHPVRPETYIEISNFYTATVYNKGAELIRMIRTLLGAERFRAGCDLYFERHDGEAATCEDFVAAMEDASGVDLARFRRWYSTAGTPRIEVGFDHDPARATAVLRLRQTIAAGTADPAACELPVPLRLALIDRATKTHSGERLLLFDKPEARFEFPGFADRPVLSINRGFSAPITLETDHRAADHAFLAAYDDDPFARFEAMQQLMVEHLIGAIAGQPRDHAVIIESVRRLLEDERIDDSYRAEITAPPSEAFLGEQMLIIDPAAIHEAREILERAIGEALIDKWRRLYEAASAIPYALDPPARGARKLQAAALSFIAAADRGEGDARAFAQFDRADNMTSRLSALAVLSHGESEEREAALDAFYNRYRSDPLVLDKWFAIQAASQRGDTVERVEELAAHADFTLANPNRVRSLYASFVNNQARFHDPSGRGYRMLADLIIRLDEQNPQTAARFVPALGRWRRYEEGRSKKMHAALQHIDSQGCASKDVAEQVMKSLG